MIRTSLTQRAEAWHTLEIVLDDGADTAPLRVKYWLLSRPEVARWSVRRLDLAKAIRTSDEGRTFDLLLDELSSEQLAAADALLRERILDWDLQDADSPDGAKLPVTPATLNAILDQMRFYRPLLQGLIDASSGMAAKKTA